MSLIRLLMERIINNKCMNPNEQFPASIFEPAEYYRNTEAGVSGIDDNTDFSSDKVHYFTTDRSQELMNKFEARHETFDPAVVDQIISGEFEERVVSKEVSEAFGTGHIITFVTTESGRKLVVRANQGLSEPEKYMEYEAKIFDMYREAGIPAGKVLKTDISRQVFQDFDYQIMEVLPGEDLKTWEGNEETYAGFNKQLGAAVAKMHNVKGSGFGRLTESETGEIVGTKETAHEYLMSGLEYHFAVIKEFELLSESQIENIQSFLYSDRVKSLMTKVEPCFIHYDIADHNLRVDGDELVALFDFENSVLFDPVLDLGSAPTWTHQYMEGDSNRGAVMKQAYINALGYAPEDLDERISLYFLRTMLWKVPYALKKGILSDKHLGLFSRALQENNILL